MNWLEIFDLLSNEIVQINKHTVIMVTPHKEYTLIKLPDGMQVLTDKPVQEVLLLLE